MFKKTIISSILLITSYNALAWEIPERQQFIATCAPLFANIMATIEPNSGQQLFNQQSLFLICSCIGMNYEQNHSFEDTMFMMTQAQELSEEQKRFAYESAFQCTGMERVRRQEEIRQELQRYI